MKGSFHTQRDHLIYSLAYAHHNLETIDHILLKFYFYFNCFGYLSSKILLFFEILNTIF